jgi:hypothetical protein
MMSVSGHKIGCPKGIGCLYKRHDVDIKPIIYGSQMDGIRGGTENVPYIIGMAKAIELLKDDVKNNSRLKMINNYFVSELERVGCKLNGAAEERLSNNISIVLPNGVNGESFLYTLEVCGIYVSINRLNDRRNYGRKHDIYYQFNDKIDTDKTCNHINKNLCATCPRNKRIVEESRQTRHKQSCINDRCRCGGNNSRNYIVFTKSRFVKRSVNKSGNKTCRRALHNAYQSGKKRIDPPEDKSARVKSHCALHNDHYTESRAQDSAVRATEHDRTDNYRHEHKRERKRQKRYLYRAPEDLKHYYYCK